MLAEQDMFIYKTEEKEPTVEQQQSMPDKYSVIMRENHNLQKKLKVLETARNKNH